MLKKIVLVLASFSMTNAFAAVDFSGANELFRARENNIANINAARDLYRQTLPQTNSAEKIYAVEQMSRLSLYQGLIEAKNENKIASARVCLKDIETIANVDGKVPVAYSYWKGLCLMGWAQTSGIAESLDKAQEILRLINQVIATDAVYEGGGGYRMAAALYWAVPQFPNPSGVMGDLKKALNYAEMAIASPAHSLEPDPETATGEYFFKSYEAKARIQQKMGQRQAAIATLQAAIARIDEGDVSMGREAEALVERRDLQMLLEQYL